MTDTDAGIRSITESARRLGIELDEDESARWLTAIAAAAVDQEVLVDAENGTFGHKVSMLDFAPTDLARFRRIGRIVEVTGPEPVVESALALSGSAAQSKIQSFPGDADYFQRLNILAPTREEACAIMARVLREKVLSTQRGETYQFLEAKFGSYHVNTARGGKGSPISWTAKEIEAGELVTETADGAPVLYRWDEVALDPGWCKLDWVVLDPARTRLSNASNVLDVTWQAPDGTITPLDGYLDAYFQEVYLDADAVPTFAKVVEFVSDDALDEYVETLETEVRKYLTKHLNYGKAAKRMYNVFRLSGRHLDAAFVREVVEALEGDEEAELVKSLLRLRGSLDDQEAGEALTAELAASQAHVVNLINTFFRDKLEAMPSIREYIALMQADEEPAAR